LLVGFLGFLIREEWCGKAEQLTCGE